MNEQPIVQTPGDLLRNLLVEKTWTQEELATIIGRSRQSINEIISGKSNITPETATILAAAFGNKPTDWLRLDNEYRLALIQNDISDIEKRSTIIQSAPIKEMQKRGWLSEAKNLEDIELELKQFFETDNLQGELEFPVAYRRTTKLSNLNKAERAWCFRARQISKAIAVSPFDENNLKNLEKELRETAAFAKSTNRVSEILSNYGIRFVVIEPLTNVRIDGAAFWLDENSPVIAMSIRFDNIGSFWFTLMHEVMHIKHKDALSVDNDIEENLKTPINESERRANEGASASLIEPNELNSFVRRVAPLYAKPRIIQFAHRIKIHPGIIVGQLQHRKEINFNAHRDLMAKVRDVATETAITDGWGKSLPIGI